MKFSIDNLTIIDLRSNTKIYIGKLLVGIITCNNKFYLDSLDVDCPDSFPSEDACIEYLLKCLNEE